jgi:Signal transduction histidine kinase
VIDTCRQLADIDRVACERVRNLIRGMKTFARLDDGEARLTDINKELEETVSLAGCQFRHGITCNLQLSELPKVAAHPQLLNQVFLNLLVNSAQAIGSQGEITVRTELEPDQIHIAFRDTGSGMTPEQKARVFQQGFTTKAPGEGSGLGLAMSREIIEDQHRGSLTFESEAGVGTTFHVRLPLTKEHSA